MYDYLLSVFLGIVEGLTEFLPVSSTAHLRICEALLHIDLQDGFWKMYTIVIQLGSRVGSGKSHWQEPGKSLGDGYGVAHRRHSDVGR
jgi:undecaprenyl pyrophosphate phosphatase UppP